MTTVELIVAEAKQQNASCIAIVNYIAKHKLDIPKRPVKPSNYLGANSTAQQHRDYANALDRYDQDVVHFKTSVAFASQFNHELDVAIEKEIWKESGLTKLPEPTASKLWEYVYKQEKFNGYGSIIRVLTELLDIVTPAVVSHSSKTKEF